MRILLYAAVDLNLIDGSSIWLASLAEVLSMEPSLRIDILTRTNLRRDVVVESLADRPNVEIINPWLDGTPAKIRLGRLRLDPKTASRLISKLHDRRVYDCLIVRDDDTAGRLLELSQLKDRLWVYICDPKRYTEPGQLASLNRLVKEAKQVLCPTEVAKQEILRRVPGSDGSAISLLPPMIPDLTFPQTKRPDRQVPKLGYAGKFDPHYLILETISAFGRIRQHFPQAEFHVLGDKFHNDPPVEGFERKVRKALSETPGVIWHGGVSREQVAQTVATLDVASSWRHPSLDDGVEVSTKILEYASLGVPCLLNRNHVQEELFGADYPGYVASERDFVEAFARLINDAELYKRASRRLIEKASYFTFSKHMERLAPRLGAPSSDRSEVREPRLGDRPKQIVFAGHLLNFVQPLIEYFQSHGAYGVSIDRWRGHQEHNATESRNLLSEADVIFCEWCLGNAVWYSERKRPGQTLIIRLHHQEMGLPYLRQLNWDNVDALVAICHHHFDELRSRFPAHADKIQLIYNLFDTAQFDRPKLEGAEYNLGFMGLVPTRKNPHIAFEILSRLKQIDSRFCLFFLGKQPQEYSWMRKRFQELKYYKQLFSEINASPYRNSAVFDGFTSDVPTWFSKIGFLLSTSEHEGSHQAVAEAMAAGTIPIIRNWEGAERLYPPEYVFKKPAEAVEMILRIKQAYTYQKEAARCRDYARSSFDCSQVLPRLKNLISVNSKRISATD